MKCSMAAPCMECAIVVPYAVWDRLQTPRDPNQAKESEDERLNYINKILRVPFDLDRIK